MGRVILTSRSFDPDVLKMLSQAFDEAWQQIVGDDQTEAILEDRRQRLATIIIGLADGVRELRQLVEAATRVMMLQDKQDLARTVRRAPANGGLV